MRAERTLLFALGACALALALESTAAAYCRTTTVKVAPDFDPSREACWNQGNPLYWPSTCVGYSLSRAASRQASYQDVASALVDAFSEWTAPHCIGASGRLEVPSIDPVFLGPTDIAKVEYVPGGSNVNVVFFRDDGWPYNDSTNSLGLTILSFDAQTGKVLDADVQINSFEHKLTLTNPPPADGYDLNMILLHEAGHFLGFAHSSSTDSVMYASYAPGKKAPLSIAADDVAAVCTVYPPNQTRPTAAGTIPAEACSLLPSSSCTSSIKRSCAVGPIGLGDAGAGGAFAGLALSAMLAARRRRLRA